LPVFQFDWLDARQHALTRFPGNGGKQVIRGG
jgi:hypothetical protein